MHAVAAGQTTKPRPAGTGFEAGEGVESDQNPADWSENSKDRLLTQRKRQ
jgi:hypothetical protein